MLSLLIWPLAPFIGLAVGVGGFRRPRQVVAGKAPSSSRKPSDDLRRARWSAAAGAAVGGAGLAISGIWALAPWPVWAAAAFVWAAAALWAGQFLVRKVPEIFGLREKSSESESAAQVLEREHALLKQNVIKQEHGETRSFQIYSLAKSLAESNSWESILNRLTQLLQKVTGSADFLLYLTALPSNKLELKWRSGVWAKEPVLEVQGLKDMRWIRNEKETLLEVPLFRDDVIWGLLKIRWLGVAPPTMADMKDVFEHLQSGLQKAHLFSRMESLSRLDGLTGVLRRQVFLERVGVEWNSARTFGTSFCFLLVDVDHFKKINDTRGHPAGDAVLAHLGKILREAIYETDAAGRYGGEEFGVLLSRAQLDGARRRAESIRQKVAQEAFPAGWDKINVTISIGLAHFPRDGKTVEEIFAAADKALYAAKSRGRNCVVDVFELK